MRSRALTKRFWITWAPLQHRLPAGVASLVEAGGDQSLHDGRVASAEYADDCLTLVIRGYDWTTDLPVAPRQFVLRHDGAVPVQGSSEELVATPADPDAEILYCELDLVAQGQFERRMLLWPARLGEIAIRFRDASVELGPAGSRGDDWED